MSKKVYGVRQYILCAAVHFNSSPPRVFEHQPRNIKEGIVLSGRRHHNCFYSLYALLGERANQNVFSKALDIQGFLTNDDLFVTREEAWVIARNAGQIYCFDPGNSNNRVLWNDCPETGQLMSEHLY